MKLQAVAFIAAALLTAPAWAQERASATISVKNHRFEPVRLAAPANVPFTLRIRNLDSTPMEFESVSLRVEKVIVGNGEGLVRLRALSPGDYQFFDDFHQEARGALIVK
jgi:hypothetical protein